MSAKTLIFTFKTVCKPSNMCQTWQYSTYQQLKTYAWMVECVDYGILKHISWLEPERSMWQPAVTVKTLIFTFKTVCKLSNLYQTWKNSTYQQPKTYAWMVECVDDIFLKHISWLGTERSMLQQAVSVKTLIFTFKTVSKLSNLHQTWQNSTWHTQYILLDSIAAPPKTTYVSVLEQP